MKKTMSLFMALVMLLTVFTASITTAQAATLAQSFKPRTSIPTASDSWMVKHNTSNSATRYVYARISEIFDKDASGIIGSRPTSISAYPKALEKAGFESGTTPRPGAVMCTSNPNRVGIVESIDYSKGTMLISEAFQYDDVSSDKNVIASLIDGEDIVGKSTISKTKGKGTGTWFDIRKINSNTAATYYYLVQNERIEFKETTNVLPASIDVSFTAYNYNKGNLSKVSVCIRKKGVDRWSIFSKSYNNNEEIIDKQFIIAENGTSKYKIDPNTEYEVKGRVQINNTYYYSSIKSFKTPSSISVSKLSIKKTTKAYTGSNIQTDNMIKVYYKDALLKKNVDYKLSVDTVSEIGNYSVTITGMGSFTGTRKVTVTVCPKTPIFKSLIRERSSNRFVLEYGKINNITKYQVQVSKSSTFASSSTCTYSIDSNKQTARIYKMKFNGVEEIPTSGTKYYFRVRTCKQVNGKMINGNWSKVKSITVS